VEAAGSSAALSFIFGSPLIAAVTLIEAAGIGGPRLPLVLLPGLLVAGIGSMVSLGMTSFTGLSTSAYALGALPAADVCSSLRRSAAMSGCGVEEPPGVLADVRKRRRAVLAAGLEVVAEPDLLAVAERRRVVEAAL
jgi:hypothetical protein